MIISSTFELMNWMIIKSHSGPMKIVFCLSDLIDNTELWDFATAAKDPVPFTNRGCLLLEAGLSLRSPPVTGQPWEI